MADELIENAEFGRKNKGEEEPILVAQRFLNIYRQMHIFNKERQEQFDNMLLQLSPDVRILLSTLPGGSLLLEHIEELEAKKGLISPAVPKNKTNTKNPQDLMQKTPTSTAAQTAKQTASNASIVIDSSFASELSNSLSFALQQTERRYKEDIKTLTETLTHSIMESQSAIANMMKDILLASHNGVPQSVTDGVGKSAKTPQNTTGNIQPATVNAENQPAISTVPQEPIKTDQKQEFISDNVGKGKDKIKPEKTPIITSSESVKSDDKKTAKNLLKNADDANNQVPENSTDDKASAHNRVDENTNRQSDKNSAAEPSTDKQTQKSSTNITELQTPKAEKNNKNSPTKDAAKHVVSLNDDNVQTTASDKVIVSETPRNKKLSELDEVMPFAATDVPEPSAKPTESDSATKADKDDKMVDFDLSDADLDLDSELGKIYNDENISESSADIRFDDTDFDHKTLDNEKDKPLDKEMAQIRQALQDTDDNFTANVTAPVTPKDTSVRDTAKQTDNSSSKITKNLAITTPDFNQEDIVSLDDIPDNPVSLDYVPDDTQTYNYQPQPVNTPKTYSPENEGDDWEWEYVDDNGNQTDENGDDWEWEYVDDNGNQTDENGDDWEWEYVDDETLTTENGNNK